MTGARLAPSTMLRMVPLPRRKRRGRNRLPRPPSNLPSAVNPPLSFTPHTPPMPKLPHGWHIYQKPERAPEEELRKLKNRFGAISRRFDRKAALKLLTRARTSTSGAA